MGVLNNLQRLLIPRKSSTAPDDLEINWRAVERWANVGIIRSLIAGTNVTIDNPDGPSPTINASGGPTSYASLTGPGQTTTPGDLTQEGGFTILEPAGTTGLGVSVNGPIQLFVASTSHQVIAIENDGTGDLHVWAVGGGKVLISGFGNGVQVCNNVSDNLGFFGATPIPRPTVTGSRGGNAALASLLTAGANLGLWTDSSTP